MGKIEKFKNFAVNFQKKWNKDYPIEINLPDYETEENDKREQEFEDEIELNSEDVNEKILNWNKFINKF